MSSRHQKEELITFEYMFSDFYLEMDQASPADRDLTVMFFGSLDSNVHASSTPVMKHYTLSSKYTTPRLILNKDLGKLLNRTREVFSRQNNDTR